MKVHQTSFNIHYSFFIGKLFPSELGLSPNSVFEGYDVSQFLILYFYSASRLLGAGLSDCHTLNQLKKKRLWTFWSVALCKKHCVRTVWLRASLWRSDVCYTRKWGSENSASFLMKCVCVCVYLLILNLYDKIGGEHLNPNCHMFCCWPVATIKFTYEILEALHPVMLHSTHHEEWKQKTLTVSEPESLICCLSSSTASEQ